MTLSCLVCKGPLSKERPGSLYFMVYRAKLQGRGPFMLQRFTGPIHRRRQTEGTICAAAVQLLFALERGAPPPAPGIMPLSSVRNKATVDAPATTLESLASLAAAHAPTGPGGATGSDGCKRRRRAATLREERMRARARMCVCVGVCVCVCVCVCWGVLNISVADKPWPNWQSGAANYV